MKECYGLLKRYYKQLTRQQILTLKGQIKKGDYIGFKKGLKKLIGNKNETRKFI